MTGAKNKLGIFVVTRVVLDGSAIQWCKNGSAIHSTRAQITGYRRLLNLHGIFSQFFGRYRYNRTNCLLFPLNRMSGAKNKLGIFAVTRGGRMDRRSILPEHKLRVIEGY